jgi:Peptidase A4 family
MKERASHVRQASISRAGGSAVALTSAFLLFLGGALSAAADHPANAAATSTSADARAPRIATVRCGHGIAAIAYIPAAGFDPLTATNAQLLANNLPQRPAGRKAMTIWRRFVLSQREPTRPACDFKPVRTHLPAVSHQVRSALHPATNPSTSGSCSANWAGNEVYDTTYDDAYGTWTVPLGGQPSSGFADSASWVGVGEAGTKDQPIVQGGSDSSLGDSVPYSLWWEVVTSSASHMNQVLTNVHYKDTIYVHIHFVAGKGQVTLDDETYGWSHTYTYTSSLMAPDGHAEWILERPESSGDYPMLADATTTFTSAEASGPGQSLAPLGKLPHEWWTMVTTSTPHVTMANPGAISSSGLSFTDQWKAYGRADAAKSGTC